MYRLRKTEYLKISTGNLTDTVLKYVKLYYKIKHTDEEGEQTLELTVALYD